MDSEPPAEPTGESPTGATPESPAGAAVPAPQGEPAAAARFVRSGEDGASFVRPDAGTGEPPSVWRRLASFVVGFGALGMAAIGVLVVLLVMLSAARPPNPFEPNGFLCCSTADSWGESAEVTGVALVLVAADVVGFALAIGLLRYAVVHRGFKVRRLIQLPALALVPALLVIGGGMAAQWDDKRTPPSCETFTYDRATYRRGGDRARELQALGIVNCVPLIGRTPKQVERVLGKNQTGETVSDGHEIGWYDLIQVDYDDRRATRVELIPPDDFD